MQGTDGHTYPLIVAYAPTGRSSCSDPFCMKHDKIIPKGEIRIGSQFKSPFGSDPNAVAVKWYHAECRVLSVQVRARANTQIVTQVNQLENHHELEHEDVMWLQEMMDGVAEGRPDIMERAQVRNENEPPRKRQKKETDAERRKRKKEANDAYDLRGFRHGKDKIYECPTMDEDTFMKWEQDEDGDWYRVFAERRLRIRSGKQKEASIKGQAMETRRIEGAQKRAEFQCFRCEQYGHYPNSCPQYTREMKRKYNMKKQDANVCLLCEQKGHYPSSCPTVVGDAEAE